MDKMDLFAAYNLCEDAKKVFKEKIPDFEIVSENSNEKAIMFWGISKNGQDGLLKRSFPWDLKGEKTTGAYFLVFDIEHNCIEFDYYPAGCERVESSCLFLSKVGGEGSDPSFQSIKTLIDLKNLKDEWNSMLSKRGLWFTYFRVIDSTGEGFLRFRFNVYWDFEKEDSIDVFKDVFYNKTIPTLLSKDMADFLSVKLLPYMDNNKTL